MHRRPVRSGLAPWPASPLEAHQRINHTVQVIEEGEQVEGEFAPGLLLAVVEDVSIHDRDRIIHDLRAIRRTVEVPPEVVEEEGDVEAQGHPLCRTQKHQTEEAVDGIFRDHQLPQEAADAFYVFQTLACPRWVPLVDGVLEVSPQLIKGYDLFRHS